MSEVTLSGADVERIQAKLSHEAGNLSDVDRALLEALLKKAEAERGLHTNDGNWAFNWTYHF